MPELYLVTNQLVSFSVPVQAAGDVEGDERAARKGVRTAGCDGQRAGDHQRETGAGEQSLAAEDRQVTHTETCINLCPAL